jgi:nucleoid-associated protein YgaU
MTGLPNRISRGLASIASIVVVFVGVPIILVIAARSRFDAASPLTGIDPPWRWDLDRFGDAVSRPLREDAIVNLLIRSSLTVIWLALAVIAATIVAEMVHMARHHGLPTPHVRGVGWAQRIGRWVAVGLIALLPVNSFASTANGIGDGGPAATAQRLGLTIGHTVARPLADTGLVPMSIHPLAPAIGERFPRPPDATNPWTQTTTSAVHVVERGDSVYAIAAEYAAGNETRTIEIADQILDLNLDNVMHDGQRFTNPALIQPGWTLTLPSGVGTPDTPGAVIDVPDAPGLDVTDDEPTPVRGIPRIEVDAATDDQTTGEHTTHVVVRGDTLSDIADHHLGGQQDWTEIWEENRDNDMGAGRTFHDPNLILPGWELEIPAVGRAVPTDEPAVDSRSPVPTTEPEPVETPTSAPDISDNRPTDTTDAAVPQWAEPAGSTPVPASTIPGVPGSGDAGGDMVTGDAAPRAPTPIRLEHAALFAAGVLTLVGVRRRRALRSALPHARIPTPPPEVAAIERRMRTIDPGERAARIDVAVRAAAHRLAGTGTQVGSVRIAKDGQLMLRLTADASLDPPWTGDGATWTLPASVPIELLSDDARQVGRPCLALVTVGIDTDDRDVLVDLEAAGTTTVVAGADQADDIVRAIGSGLATSLASEVVHLMVASLGADCLFDHPNAHRLASVDDVMHAATSLVGSTVGHERSTFDLRSRRTGGEMWEPAIALFASADRAVESIDAPEPGHGLAVVAACSSHGTTHAASSGGARLVGHADRWVLEAFGEAIELRPIGVTAADVDDIVEILADASRPIDHEPPVAPVDLGNAVADPFQPRAHDIVVGLMGSMTVRSAAGVSGQFERSKTVELIAWLATHRDRATRAAARTALWEMDVRDATFANVVSEARRALGRLVGPPEGEEWLARTLNESLPLHARVVTDADLIEERVEHARLAPPAHAIDVLRPAVEMIRDLPFAGTSYLWPDADGITSRLVLLATTAAGELAGHALSIGDTDLVFWSTGQGLRVLPGHEELIGLRMRAHARAGDLAGVRQEWESYERVIMADSWSDGEPAPKLLDLRRELLTAG